MQVHPTFEAGKGLDKCVCVRVRAHLGVRRDGWEGWGSPLCVSSKILPPPTSHHLPLVSYRTSSGTWTTKKAEH